MLRFVTRTMSTCTVAISMLSCDSDQVQSFSGHTDVSPGISFSAYRSQPAFRFDGDGPVEIRLTVSAPDDCRLSFSTCSSPPAQQGFAGCGSPSVSAWGTASSVSWTVMPQTDPRQVAVSLETVPRSANGPLCQSFSGVVSFSGTAVQSSGRRP